MKRFLLSAMALLAGSVAGCGASGATDKCAMVTCAAGQFCDGTTGMCRTGDRCMGVTCATGQVCDGATGMCVAKDLCAGVVCTYAQTCNPTNGTCENPPMPTVGMLIDRMGRPAVNTALTNPFDLYRPGGAGMPIEASDVTKNRYNRDGNPANWVANWGAMPPTAANAAINMHLAILDGLDGGTCGNQLAFNGTTKYATLTGVLTADVLQLDSSRTTCNQYLSVELNALGIANTNCGGRTLSMDTIDTTYSALAIGMTTGVNDGIAQSTAPSATFPFFTAPQ
jgi:hypothetical protein